MDSMHDRQRGQILLIVVLVMVTALTIALSVAARSITNTRSSDEAAKSEQAFSAAEAGIEKALTINHAVSGTFSNSATYQTTFVTVGGVDFTLNNGSAVLKDEPADLWLSTYPGYTLQRNGNITIYWANPSDSCNANESLNSLAALEIIVFTEPGGTPQTSRFALDPCPDRGNVNGFDNNDVKPVSAGDTIAGVQYAYKYTINNVNSGLFARIIPLYAPTIIGVRGCDENNVNCTPFPTQGTLVQAVGTVSDTERKIQSYRYYPQLPAEILQYNFFVPK